MKDTCKMMETRTSSRDPDGCLVQSEVDEEKETTESYLHFTKDNEDGNRLC